MAETDISDTLAPKSDQLDAVDLASGPRVFTITECVTRDAAEQPTTIRFAEFPRPWKPSKNMRRVLAFCWGGKGSLYTGRRVMLYCDPNVVYAGEKVGGIRIKALSHIKGPMDAPILPTRGKGALWHVEPLSDDPATERKALLARISGLDDARKSEIAATWQRAHGHRINETTDLTALEALVATIEAEMTPDGGQL